ncbi:MAG: DUF2178 domain-containing protein [Promethearchaeota archaeon]
MNRKELTWCRMMIVLVMGALIGWSVSVGNIVLLMVAFVVGPVALYLLRSRIEEVMEDERIHLIHEKASARTVQVFAMITVSLGAILIALSRSGHADFSQSGFTLAYSACALLILHLIFRGYYRKKYGV